VAFDDVHTFDSSVPRYDGLHDDIALHASETGEPGVSGHGSCQEICCHDTGRHVYEAAGR
jgi:hypothetical protein